jgi:hypothetical protein
LIISWLAERVPVILWPEQLDVSLDPDNRDKEVRRP